MLRTLMLLLALFPVLGSAAEMDAQANPIVEGVQCNGNLATSCELIRRQSGILAGKELDDIQVENARLRLAGLTQFRSVRIHLIKGSRKHWVIVVIDVVESSPITTAFAAGALLQLPLHADETGVVAGRVTNYDLLGSGKALDFALVASRPLDGGGSDEYSARLEYRDPRLFGSRTFFFTLGAFYSRSSFNENYNIPLGTPEPQLVGGSGTGGGVDFSVGMHLGTYSYVTAGYRYLPNANSADSFLVSDGIFTTLNSTGNNVMLFTLGRNTEDDPAFPTHGWLLHAYDGFDPISGGDFAGVLIRGTWRAGDNSYWTFQARPFDNFRSLFDDDLGASIVYSRNFSSNTDAGSRRARWYVGPGLTNLGHYFYGDHYYDVGVKAGVRLETKYFGTVNFYLLATYPVRVGN